MWILWPKKPRCTKSDISESQFATFTQFQSPKMFHTLHWTLSPFRLKCTFADQLAKKVPVEVCLCRSILFPSNAIKKFCIVVGKN